MTKPEPVLQLIRTAKLAVAKELTLNTGAVGTPTQLTAILKKLEAMEQAIGDNNLPPQSQRDRGMGRMISDAWPLGSELGEKVLLAEDAYVRF